MRCDSQGSGEKKKTINNIKPCWKPLTWSSRLLPTYLVINKSQTVPTLHRPQLLKGPIVLFWNCHLCSDILSCFLSLGVPIQSSCPSSVISLALSCLYCTITFTWQWELLINWNGLSRLPAFCDFSLAWLYSRSWSFPSLGPHFPFKTPTDFRTNQSWIQFTLDSSLLILIVNQY